MVKMIPNRDEYKIISEYLIQNLNFDKIYKDTSDVSTMSYTKKTIIDHIRNLILKYPDHFDTSVKGRVEFETQVFKIRLGILNNYMYLCNADNYKFGWLMTENNLFNIVNYCKLNDYEYFIFDYKIYLRNYKIKKIWEITTQTTN
jgi:hypothetical protein